MLASSLHFWASTFVAREFFKDLRRDGGRFSVWLGRSTFFSGAGHLYAKSQDLRGPDGAGWLIARGPKELSRLKKLVLPAYLACCCALLPFFSWVNAEEPLMEARIDSPRRIVLVLDGVPFETIKELRAEGHFKSFRPPARMVSTFPSLTNPSMIEIMGASDSQGYEDHYFDREQNRLVGGFQDRVRGGKFIHGTFREKFDYHAPALRGSFAYIGQPLGAILIAQADISGFTKAFRKSKEPVFVGYVGATDSLAHLGGEGPLKLLLKSLDRTIEDLRKESGGTLEVELVSDHGNNFTTHRHVGLGSALEKAGFKMEKSLKSTISVVLPRYGLVGAGVLFTNPENRQRVAEVCAVTKGVDFAVYHAPGDEGRIITLVGKQGRARIYREGERYRYEATEGDPLALEPVITAMAENGTLDTDGFASVEDWWLATRDHKYADPLRRLFDSFSAHVVYRGDVIVSFENGYLVGSPFFGAFALMFATHGNLLQGETDGFAMSTRQDIGPAVRGSDVHKLFGLEHLGTAASYISSEGHCQAGRVLAMRLTGNRVGGRGSGIGGRRFEICHLSFSEGRLLINNK